jgi:hypothetical protein
MLLHTDDFRRRSKHMRSWRYGFGLTAGLLLAASLSRCSFYVPAQAVCQGPGCQGQGDLGPPADLRPDPADPSLAGPYQSAPLVLSNPPAGLTDQLLLLPSDDGTTLSGQKPKYPLILIAPSQGMPLSTMRSYADQLASHGFVVALFQVTAQTNHASYRDTGLAYLNFVLSSTDPNLKSHLDTTKLGLLGYELGGKIGAAMAAQDSRIGALFLIDPADLLTGSGAINGIAAIGQVTLAGGAAVGFLGEPLSTTGSSPCLQAPQAGWADFYTAAKGPALAITFATANQGDFIEGFPDPACIAGSPAARSTTQALARKYATAYFQWTLLGQARQRDYLLGSDFVADQPLGMVSRQSK